MSAKKIQVKQVRSGVRAHFSQRQTLKALGLGKIGRSREHNCDPSTIGMIRAVAHLVHVEPVK